MGQHRRQPSSSDYTKTWEPRVAETIRQKLEHGYSNGNAGNSAKNEHRKPFMISLSGIPGSGKTISAMVLANILEETHGIQCFVAPHDGYHFPLQHLRIAFGEYADDVIYRRGAPETFDAEALLRDLRRIRDGEEPIISLPGFDHAKGDPEPDHHVFDRSRHRVVLCEGLYLLHDRDGWQDVQTLFDWKIFIDSDVDECMRRVAVRNQCIPGYSPEEIMVRVERVDRVNALTVMEGKERADLVVESVIKTILSPDAMAKTHRKRLSSKGLLSSAELLDVAGASADWAMDIGARPRSDSLHGPLHPLTHSASFSRRDRSDSVLSNRSEPPEPIGKIVGTWEKSMAERIGQLVEEQGRSPFMVALCAGPGSGKSVSAMLLANHLEKMNLPCMIMPHDGYHYPLDYLKTFPNTQDAIYRRGAPDTFDPHALVRDLKRIRDGDEDIIKIPAFDHARADPEPDTHVFDRNAHKVVICEGLYLLHDGDGWEDVPGMFDFRIFMDANIETCMERIKIRNQCIPGYSPEEIAERAERVDRTNFMTVLNSKVRADVCVEFEH